MRNTMVWKIAAMVAVMTFTGLVAGCTPQAGTEVARLEEIAESCPDGVLLSVVAVDVSGSQSSARVLDQAEAVIEDTATYTAVCQGRIEIRAFAVDVATTQVVYAGDLATSGATQISRLRKVEGTVASVMGEVETALPDALAFLPRDNSAILAQLAGAGEALAQVQASTGKPVTLNLVIASDGQDTTVPGLVDPALTVEQAIELAGTVAVPDLSGARIQMVGVGRVDGTRLSPEQTATLKAFWTEALTRTGAEHVAVVTDFVSGASR